MVVFLFFVFSCTKEKREMKKEEQLAGKWQMIHMTNNEPDIVWEFVNDSVGTFIMKSDTAEDASYSKSYYILTEKNYKYFIDIEGIDHTFVDGRYLILIMTDDILAIERVDWHYETNPFLRREFLRIKE
jgi:hypothetical protein